MDEFMLATLAELQQEELALSQEYAKFLKDNALLTYRPHAKQIAFHRAPHKFRITEGGNRSGKSKCNLNEFGAFTRGSRLWEPKDSPFYLTPFVPPIRAKIGSTPKNIKQCIQFYLPTAFLEGELTPGRKDQNGVPIQWFHKNGSIIDILSYEQDDDAFESDAAHIYLFDEPPPRNKFVGASRALADFEGYMLIAQTPLSQPWIQRELVAKAKAGHKLYFHSTFDIEDNLNYGLTRAGIDQFADTLTDAEKETRLRGKPLYLQGLVVSEFQRDIHVISPNTFMPDAFPNGRWNPNWGMAIALDVHLRQNQAVLFGGVDPSGAIHFFDELWSPARNVDELVREIQEKLLGYFCYMKLVDPSATAPDAVDRATSLWQELGRRGQVFTPGSKALSEGLWLLKSLFKVKEGHAPNVYIWENCWRTIFEIENYCWKDWEKAPNKVKPIDEDDHMMENMRRLVQEGLFYCERDQFQSTAPVAWKRERYV